MNYSIVSLARVKEQVHHSLQSAMLHLSPCGSESGDPLETLLGTEASLLDQGRWPGTPCEPGSPCSPMEYRTLFDCNGLIFNTCQSRSTCCGNDYLKVPPSFPACRSPCQDTLGSLLDPSSPGHRQLAAVLKAPPTLCPSLALLHCIEMDPGVAERELAAPRGRFLRAATHLHSRLVDLDTEASCLLYEGLLLRHGFQELLTDADQLLTKARRLQQDLRDVLYLNDLLWLLRGRLERVSRRRWPFLTAHTDTVGEVNLVV